VEKLLALYDGVRLVRPKLPDFLLVDGDFARHVRSEGDSVGSGRDEFTRELVSVGERKDVGESGCEEEEECGDKDAEATKHHLTKIIRVSGCRESSRFLSRIQRNALMLLAQVTGGEMNPFHSRSALVVLGTVATGSALSLHAEQTLAPGQQQPPVATYSTTVGPNQQSSTGQGTSTTEPGRSIRYIPVMMDAGCGFTPQSSGGAYEQRAAMIDKHGPYIPPVFSMSALSVMGFARGNWPVVIDYLLEEDALLLIVVAPEGSEPILYRLNGKKGHWQQRFSIPARVGDQPRVAHYVVRSLGDNQGQVTPAHLHIHGIAAGNKAVGSIGIDVVKFAPNMIHSGKQEKARYSFHSMFDFKNTEVTFVRLAQASGEIIAAAVGQKSMGSVTKNGIKSGDWDGKVTAGDALKGYPPDVQQWLREPRGQHILQVRAWWGAKDGGDWVTAMSDDLVSVE
jgi:hypothetical protein